MTFQKGQSGNPKGRPIAEDFAVKQLAKVHTEAAIKTLVYWMKNRKNAKASVSACMALLERGYGKPAQETIIKSDEAKFLFQIIK